MSWIYLLVAGGLEVVWALSMKLSHGFTRLTPTIITLVAMVGSVALLALAMRELPLGTSYMIWTGIGALGAFVVGVSFLGEPLSLQRTIAAALILSGLVTMKLSSEPLEMRLFEAFRVVESLLTASGFRFSLTPSQANVPSHCAFFRVAH